MSSLCIPLCLWQRLRKIQTKETASVTRYQSSMIHSRANEQDMMGSNRMMTELNGTWLFLYKISFNNCSRMVNESGCCRSFMVMVIHSWSFLVKLSKSSHLCTVNIIPAFLLCTVIIHLHSISFNFISTQKITINCHSCLYLIRMNKIYQSIPFTTTDHEWHNYLFTIGRTNLFLYKNTIHPSLV